jgi:tetratricopeptide (TPR) repeat protein
VEILQTLSAENPENIRIKSELANSYMVLGRRQAGIDCYNELIRIDSTNLYYKIQKAELLYQQGKYDKALELFYTVYAHNRSPNSLTQIAQCYEKMNEADSAIVYFKNAWEINPYDSFSAVSLVNLCIKNKRLGEALAYSTRYLESDTTNQQMNLLNALTYYAMDDYYEAVARFRKCYEAGDTSLIVNRSLGISYYSISDNYEAEIFLDKAFSQDTTNNNVLYCLAVSSNELADHKKAIPLFHKLLDRTIPPDLTLYLYYKGLASAYDKGSHFEDAANTYIKASNYGGTNQQMTTYYTIARIYETHLDDNANALVYYRLYRTSLVEYLENMKQKGDTEASEIAETISKIKYLDEHIKGLEKKYH